MKHVYFEPASMGQPGPVQMRIFCAGDLASLSAMANRVARDDWKRSTSPRLNGIGPTMRIVALSWAARWLPSVEGLGSNPQAVSGKIAIELGRGDGRRSAEGI